VPPAAAAAAFIGMQRADRSAGLTATSTRISPPTDRRRVAVPKLSVIYDSRGRVKPAFHDADADTVADILADILATILARMSACRSACYRNNFRKSRVSDVGVSGESESMSASWIAGFTDVSTTCKLAVLLAACLPAAGTSRTLGSGEKANNAVVDSRLRPRCATDYEYLPVA